MLIYEKQGVVCVDGLVLPAMRASDAARMKLLRLIMF
jgi:hypothetical protein